MEHPDPAAGSPPASGAWQPGDDPGRRRFVTLFADTPLELEAGRDAGARSTVAYETWGELDADAANAVLVLHALTGDSHAAGPRRARPPLPRLVGRRHRAREVASTPTAGSSSAPTSSAAARARPARPRPRPTAAATAGRFPRITIRDQVAVEAALADALGDRAVGRRRRRVDGRHAGPGVGRRLPRRASTAASWWRAGRPPRAEQIALCSVQIEAIRADARFRGGDYYDAPAGEGPHRGMGVARKHRPLQLPHRGGVRHPLRPRPPGRRGPLRRRALRGRVLPRATRPTSSPAASTPTATWSLSEAMNHHDVGRGRGGVGRGPGQVKAKVAVAGID